MTAETRDEPVPSIDVFDEDLFDAWTGARMAGAFDIVSSYVTGQALLALDRVGALGSLRHGPQPEHVLLAHADHDIGRALLRYCIQCGLLRATPEGAYSLTSRGHLLASDTAIARLGVYAEAYAPVLGSLPALTSGQLTYGVDVHRDGASLGRHCATLFSAFHSRIVQSLLPEDCTHLVDLGCGGGSLIVDACRDRSELVGTGIDEAPGAIQEAESLAARSGIGGRASFVRADVFDIDSWCDQVPETDFLTAFSVVHELFRDGQQAVVAWFTDLRAKLPHVTRFLIGEPELGREGVDNDHEFELIHRLTRQGLPAPQADWVQVFAASPWRLESVRRRAVGPALVYYELSC